MRIKFAFLLLVLVFFSLTSKSAEKEVALRYGQMLKDAFDEKGTGRIIPVSIDKAVEIDGSMTSDGEYMVYVSDREQGNLDIYLRLMTGIQTVRLTTNAGRDLSPSISPDGSKIAFVSYREDPAGDIFISDFDASEIIGDSEEGILDREAKNISQMRNAAGISQMVKDSDPAWSPDGGTIAFSSARDGEENIYICRQDGSEIKKITSHGGLYPSFSRDGKRIIYVSYRKGTDRGDIFIVDIESGGETRVTSSSAIELYPSFSSSDSEIIYTKIDADTNHDGKIDLKDNSSLWYLNTENGFSYPLTDGNSSAFRGRWFPSYSLKYFNSPQVNFSGVILFSEELAGNININLMPEYGYIPKRKTAEEQLALCRNYYNENGYGETYINYLLRVFFFHSRADKTDQMFAVRALGRACMERSVAGESCNDIISLLKSVSFNKTYSSLLADLSLKGVSSVEEKLNDAGDALPFIMEDIGDYYLLKNNAVSAAGYYGRVLDSFPKYSLYDEVLLKKALLFSAHPGREIPDSFLKILFSGDSGQVEKIISKLTALYEKERPEERIRISSDAIANYSEKLSQKGIKPKEASAFKILLASLYYVRGQAYLAKGEKGKAKEDFLLAMKDIKTTFGIYYKVNFALAEINKGSGDEEKYLYECASNYLQRWKEPSVRDVVLRLVKIYEDNGAAFEKSGNYKQAALLYKKYYRLLSYLYQRRQFNDVYVKYSPRAHILYVDAEDAASGYSPAGLNKTEEEYLKGLSVARMDFDRNFIYGLAYLYCKKAQAEDSSSGILSVKTDEYMDTFEKSLGQIEWALFMDDSFVDAYLLKGWIYQFLDRKIEKAREKNDAKQEEKLTGKFSPYLLEKSRVFYARAIEANDEIHQPESEGNLLVNLGNVNFLLNNFNDALKNYRAAQKYKKHFSSKKEEAFFLYHFSYCLWQNGNISEAKNEMEKVEKIYLSLSSGNAKGENDEALSIIRRFFALFDRMDGKYEEAEKRYFELLDTGKTKKPVIDRARVLQEIALCREEQGDFSGAIKYLNLADEQINKESFDEGKSRVNLKLLVFGPFPFPFYDLGDNAVIGNSRIVKPLNARQKKLLNLEMLSRISRNMGDLAGAAIYLQKKLKVCEDQDSQLYRETYGITLNSLGETYFRQGDYKTSEKFFSKAWKYAEENSLSELSFSAVMNISELNCYLCEKGISGIPSLDAVLKKIGDYKAAFVKNRTTVENEVLEAKAETENRKVTEAEKNNLARQIEEEASMVFLRLDLCRAILMQEKAEIIFSSGGEKEAFPIYKDCVESYRKALKTGETFSGKMKIRIQLNRAQCLERLGLVPEAYEAYGNAEKECAAAYYEDLFPSLFSLEGKFAAKYYARLNIPKSSASAFFERAVGAVEKCPQSFVSKKDELRNLYNSYAFFLADNSQIEKSMLVLEKLAAVERSIRAVSFAPLYAEPKMRETAFSVKKAVSKFALLSKKLTKLSESGDLDAAASIFKERDSAALEVLSASSSSEELSKFFNPVQSKLASTDIPYVIIADDNSSVRVWTEIKGKISYRKVPRSDAENLEKLFDGKFYLQINPCSMTKASSEKISLVALSSDVDNLPEYIESEAPFADFPGKSVETSENIRETRGAYESLKSIYSSEYTPVSLSVSDSLAEFAFSLSDAALFAGIGDVRFETSGKIFHVGRCFSQNKTSSSGMLEKIIVLADSGKTQMAKRLAAHYRASQKNSPDSLFASAWLLDKSGRSEAAMNLFPVSAAVSASDSKKALSFALYLLAKNGRTRELAESLDGEASAVFTSPDARLYLSLCGDGETSLFSQSILPSGMLKTLAEKFDILNSLSSFSDADGIRLLSGKRLQAETAFYGHANDLFVHLKEASLSGNVGEVAGLIGRLKTEDFSADEKIDLLMLMFFASRAAFDAGLFSDAGYFCDRAAEICGNSFPCYGYKAKLLKARQLCVQGKYAEAKEIISGSAFPQKYSAQEKLLQSEISMYGAAGDDAGLVDLFSSKDVRTAYVARLLFAQSARLKISSDRKNSDEDFNLYYSRILDALNFAAKKAGPALAESERRDLLLKGINFLVSYNLSRGEFRESLRYAEIKKQMEAFSFSVFVKKPSEAEISRFVTLTQSDFAKASSMLASNPGLYYHAFLNSVNLDAFRGKIPTSSVVLYAVKNENDIFTWIMDKDKISYRRIENAYSASDTFFRKGLSSENIRNMRELFSKEINFAGKRQIYVISDGECSGLPLDSIFNGCIFIPSINQVLANSEAASYNSLVTVLSDNEADAVAVKQSGMKLTATGAGVFYGRGDFLSGKEDFFINGASLSSLLKGKAGAVLFSQPGLQGSFNSLAQLSSSLGLKFIVIASPQSEEANLHVFLSSFFSGLVGDGAERAFKDAKGELEKSSRFFESKYRDGIRLYLNGFGKINE